MLGALLPSDLSRRQFDDLRAIAQPAKPVHVVILGAGLAGLCAAYELERRGHTAVVLEAETRHVKEMGLTLRPFVQSNPEAYYYLRGQRERIKNVRALTRLYDLQDSEKEKTLDDLWTKAVVRRLEALSDAEKADLSADTPTTAAVRTLDQLSLQQLCEGAGLSQEAIDFLASASSGAFAWFTPGQHSALYRDVVAPEGRILFAGEHASLSHTWMQGALESALRAVREILTAE
jgi:monoamine oxidase